MTESTPETKTLQSVHEGIEKVFQEFTVNLQPLLPYNNDDEGSRFDHRLIASKITGTLSAAKTLVNNYAVNKINAEKAEEAKND